MANDNESETPIEDKQGPPSDGGNLIADIIRATLFIGAAAYGSSAFIYMLHISNEEKRKMKEANKDIRLNGQEFSVLSGSYIYGPPYFPNNKTVINFDPKDPKAAKTRENPKDFSDVINYEIKAEEQKTAIDTSYSDSLATSKFMNDAWNKNCPKKIDKYGKPFKKGKYTPNSRADTLHDWLYYNSTFCNAANLKTGAYKDESNTWEAVTANVGTKVMNLVSKFIFKNKNEENLNDGQIAYRKKTFYNLYKYIFFIFVGTLAFTRNIMNKVLQNIGFDNNEFEYWDKTKESYKKNPNVRIPKKNYDSINSSQRYIARFQSLIVLIFALFNRSIFPTILMAGLFIGGIGSIVFALYKWNFTTMLTWWSASTDYGPVGWLILSIVSLLFWFLAIYLMLIVPGFMGQINSFIIPIIIIATLFVYPFSDNTEVYVKHNNPLYKYFTGNYSIGKAFNNPIESKKGKLNDKNQCVSTSWDGKVTLMPHVQKGPEPNVSSTEKDSEGNFKILNKEKVYTKIPDDPNKEPHPSKLISDKKCYEKYIKKLSGREYIQHLVSKNLPLWISLLIHDIVRFVDKDTSIHKVADYNLTLVGDPSSSMSINMGTIPLIYFIVGKVLSIIRNR
tara:strand:- start:832 stop:2685 length:1854 start_codon:yes stop_codon:yes gene_type:complete